MIWALSQLTTRSETVAWAANIPMPPPPICTSPGLSATTEPTMARSAEASLPNSAASSAVSSVVTALSTLSLPSSALWSTKFQPYFWSAAM